MTIIPRRWVPDGEAPAVARVEALSANSVKLYFTKPVLGAELPEHFRITGGQTDRVVSQAVYLPEEQAVLLTTAEPLEDAHYRVECVNITDSSMERNPLAGGGSFTLGDPDALADRNAAAGFSYWWVPVLILASLLVAVAAAVAMAQKKTAREQPAAGPAAPPPRPEVRRRIHAANRRAVQLVVKDRGGAAHKVDIKIDGSFFVGSSGMCNLSFEDEKLMPQHFVLEAGDEGFFIQDLDTPGGTYVNGVRIGTKHRLLERDRINAGQEEFIFLGPGR